jgi:hypothetical protein
MTAMERYPDLFLSGFLIDLVDRIRNVLWTNRLMPKVLRICFCDAQKASPDSQQVNRFARQLLGANFSLVMRSSGWKKIAGPAL